MEHLPLVNGLPDVLAKRARHVVTENNRVLAGIKALEAGILSSWRAPYRLPSEPEG